MCYCLWPSQLVIIYLFQPKKQRLRLLPKVMQLSGSRDRDPVSFLPYHLLLQMSCNILGERKEHRTKYLRPRELALSLCKSDGG